MKKSILPILLTGILLSSSSLNAQEGNIRNPTDLSVRHNPDDTVSVPLTGTVFAVAKGVALPGATVRWRDSKLMTQTDASGRFSLPALREGGTLMVSYIGYGTQLINVAPGQTGLEITLAVDQSTSVGEVVVTALGARRNTRNLGYAIQQLEGKEIQEAKEVNFINSLQGRLSGVQVLGNSGAMGGSAKVTVRGYKSISGDNNALFIIDGIPLANMNLNTPGQGTGGGGFDYGNPAQLINPGDIENISVLKGAAATALYGSRGQNGVIYITTKSGKDAGQLTVNYDLNMQMHQVSLLPRYQDEYGGGRDPDFGKLYYNQYPDAFGPGGGTYDDHDGKGSYDLLPQYSVDESWGPRLDGRQVRHYWSWDKEKNNPDFGKTAPWVAQPDNVKDFFRTGLSLSNNLSVSGAGHKGTIRLSLGQTHQQFIYPGSHLNRIFLGLNTTCNFTSRLQFSAGISYISDQSRNRPGTGFNGYNPMLQFVMYGQRQLDMERLKHYKYADGTEQTWNRAAWNNAAPVSAQNPYWNLYQSYNTDRNNRYFGNAGFTYRINSWLSADARVFADLLDHLDEGHNAKDYLGGSYLRRTLSYKEANYQGTLNLKKSFAGDRISLDAIAGGNILQVKSETESGATNGGLMSPGVYVLQNSVLPATVTNAYANYQTNSLFASAVLGYRNWAYLTLTGRNDWASPLAQTGDYAFFYPSVAGSFIFSELVPQNAWMTYGKARLSYAQAGNITTPYMVSRYFDFNAPFSKGGSSYSLQSVPDILFNDKLKPERSKEVEGGFDFRFFSGRLGISFTYYDRKTENQIWNILLPPETGYSSKIVNGGTVRNRGIELSISATPVISGSFSWETMINFSRNRNTVLDLNANDGNIGGLETFVIGTERRTQRVSVVAMKGKSLGTIIGTDYVYDANGNKVVTDAGYYAVTAKSVVIGDVNPDFFGGISNTFNYKNIYLSGLVDFQKGGSFFSYTNLYGNKSGLLAETAAGGIRENGIVNEGVKPDGSINDKVITAKDHFNSDGGNRISKANLYDASYIYLRELRLGWNLPVQGLSKARVQHARLSLVGRNLWLLYSKAPNVDPSNINNSIGNTPGLEGGALPPVRSYGISLNIMFK
jgi:TonB-linked SusC/RagA family outer membrane protein